MEPRSRENADADCVLFRQFCHVYYDALDPSQDAAQKIHGWYPGLHGAACAVSHLLLRVVETADRISPDRRNKDALRSGILLCFVLIIRREATCPSIPKAVYQKS